MNILFITSTRIGDAILSTGLLKKLLEASPNAKVTIACGPAVAPLFADLPNLKECIIMRKKPFDKHWLELWQKCVLTKWEVVVDLRASLTAYFLWTKKRFIWRPLKDSRHRVLQLSELFSLKSPADPYIWLSKDRLKKAEALMPKTPVLAIAPAANWRGKQWRPERFKELIEHLIAPTGLFPQAKIAFFASPNEKSLIEELIHSVPEERRLDLVGKVDLLTLYGCLKQCALFIGNDSGLMHLAAASNIPTIGLFGPSRVEHYAPWGKNTAVAKTPIPFEKLINFEGYNHRTTDTLMDSLTVEKVLEVIHSFIKP